MKYAAATNVSVEKSRAEIESIVRKYGATEFASGWSAGRAMIGFEMNHRQIRFQLTLPSKTEKRFTQHPRYSYRTRTEAQALVHWEQACRQLWRALALAVKAKLEAVECGISEFDQEFMANIVMPDGQTIGEHLLPRLEAALSGGPPLLGYTPAQ